MQLRARWVTVCLGVLALPLESVAAEKADLEAFIAVVPMQGDQQTFLTEGDDYTDAATSVTPGPKRSVFVVEQTYATSEGSTTELRVVVHGKKLLIGTVVFNDGTDEIALVRRRPKKLVQLQLVPGKTYKFRMGSKVFYNGFRAGNASEFGTVSFLGFEDVITPLGTFEGAAHLMRTDSLLFKGGGDSLEIRDTIESWEVEGLGTVRFFQSEVVYENGMLTESTPAQEWFFDHGVIQGVPVGPPMATGGASRPGLADANAP
jgi:hypothetical protein